MSVRACHVCGEPMISSVTEWAWRCSNCGFLSSDLWDSAKWERKASALDESHRLPGIRALRLENAEIILDRIARFMPLEGASICDIGCGYGWFVEAARERGANALGIEPEERIAATAVASGLQVKAGLFPDALEAGQSFDVLCFNDVLEHLPDPGAALEACGRILKPGGILSITIPSSNGILYRIASVLAAIGISGPFDRLWQRSFHSPHLSYFNPRNLERMARNHGFSLLLDAALPTVKLSGLWSRIMMDSSQSRISAAALWTGVATATPALGLLPPDIIHQLFRRP